MAGVKMEVVRSIISVVEVGIQACPLASYAEALVNSGLFLKGVASVLDDQVLDQATPFNL